MDILHGSPGGALAGALLEAVTGWARAALLLSLRVAAALAMTPLLRAVPLPGPVRFLIVLALAGVLATGLGSAVPWAGWPGFMKAAATELALGATLGLGILLAFAAFAVAGQLLDVQLGFGLAQAVDPATQRPASVLSVGFQYLGIVLFFLAQGHHALLRGLAWSAEQLPPGAAWPLDAAWEPLARQASAMFGLGFALAAPVAIGLLLLELVLGVLARQLPQMNLFVLGLPVRILAGLAALTAWAPGMGAVVERVHAGIHATWLAFFAGAQALPR